MQCSTAAGRSGQVWDLLFFLTCFSHPHQHRLTQPVRGLRHHLPCLFFFSISQLYAGAVEDILRAILYVVIIIAWVGSLPDPTSCCIIIVLGRLKAQELLIVGWVFPRQFFYCLYNRAASQIAFIFWRMTLWIIFEVLNTALTWTSS